MTKFLQSNCDMCDNSPCVMVCEQGVEKSHNILERTKGKKNNLSQNLRNQIICKMPNEFWSNIQTLLCGP